MQVLPPQDHVSLVLIPISGHQASGAEYQNYYNTKNGMIVAAHNFGPAYYKENEKGKNIVIPPLNKLSDVAFLQWKKVGGGKPKWFFRYEIAEANTNQVIDELLEMAGESSNPPVWPGRQYQINTGKT